VTYLFTRRTRLTPGHGTAGVDWARSVTERVGAVTGRELRLWGTAYSAGLGTIAWAGWFDTLDALERFGDALAADPALEKLTNAASRYTEGGFDDALVEPIFRPQASCSARYVCRATAVAAGGATSVAAAGVEIAQQAEAVTGRPTMFGRSLTGRDGAVHWLTGYESVAALEVAGRALSTDPRWLELVDATRGRFATARHTTIYRRLG
jgi:hypothetical protein